MESNVSHPVDRQAEHTDSFQIQSDGDNFNILATAI